MKRVVLVAWDWPAFAGGGAAALLQTLACGLAARQVEVTVWTRGGGARDPALRVSPPLSGVRVFGFAGRSWRTNPVRHWVRGVVRHAASSPPDLVVVGSLDALPGVAEGLGRVGVTAPVWTIAHGRDVTGDRSGRHAALRARAWETRSGWFCLTTWMQQVLAARGKLGAVVVPAAVPAPLPRRRGGRSVLALGRLIPRKGHDVLIDAIAQLPGAQLDVVGTGPELGRLRARVAAHAMEARVRFHGVLDADSLRARWDEAAVLAAPTREEPNGDTEGYGLVFLEAAARGLPVVAGATAGVREAVEDGVTGLLVSDPRDPRAVADALAAVLGDPVRAEAMGAAGRGRWELRGRPEHLADAVLRAEVTQ